MLHHIDDIDYTKFFKLAEDGQTRGHTLKLVKQKERQAGLDSVSSE